MNRAVLAAVVVAVAAAPAPAAIAKPKPKIPACTTISDPAGDSGPGAAGVAPLNDPTLDITKVRFSTVDKALVTTFTVGKYANRPTAGTGNRYQVAFDLDGKLVEIYWKDGPLREHEANAFYQQGVRVAGTFVHDGVKGTAKGNTVTMSVKLTMLKSAVGSKVEGARAENVRAQALSSYVAQNFAWDTADGPGFVVGATCR
jgi:hypothetical protein